MEDNNKNDKWSKTMNYAKQRSQHLSNNMKDSIIDKKDNLVNDAKTKFNSSTLGQYANAKGIKGKLALAGKNQLSKIKGYDFIKKISDIILKTKEIIAFIVANIETIAIVAAVIIYLYVYT